jgi:hypothetical protein
MSGWGRGPGFHSKRLQLPRAKRKTPNGDLFLGDDKDKVLPVYILVYYRGKVEAMKVKPMRVSSTGGTKTWFRFEHDTFCGILKSYSYKSWSLHAEKMNEISSKNCWPVNVTERETFSGDMCERYNRIHIKQEDSQEDELESGMLISPEVRALSKKEEGSNEPLNTLVNLPAPVCQKARGV